MKAFLYDIAEKIYADHPKLEDVAIVFPNRRAILYFRKHLGTLLKKPAFAPRLLTIEDFIHDFSTHTIPDKLELVFRLHQVYREAIQLDEAFDKFYFWGEMLLRDFDEVDKHMANASLLFQYLSEQKEIDTRFDFLTEEQKSFLQNFWGNFFKEPQSENKRKFLLIWKHLGTVYQNYREQLNKEGLAYEGMLQREVAEKILSGSLPVENTNIYFVGFNALTKAEETVITHWVKAGAQIFWDIDDYYLNNRSQEAGQFFRAYQAHDVLGRTFPPHAPANFKSPKAVHVLGAPQPVGQAKALGQLLAELLNNGKDSEEETLIVLPDEKMLLPVLHSVAGYAKKLNVTMGFPLASTPLFTLLESLVEMQHRRKGDYFHHRQVMAILNHPYGLLADASVAHNKRKEINKHNWVFIPKSYLATGTDLHRLFFTEATVSTIVDYLREVIKKIGADEGLAPFDREYAFHFLKCLNRLHEVLGNSYSDLPSFLRFFRQYIRSQKIPFSGEPLQGLQIMGMLETRNLDFKNVYILSLNEGILPAAVSRGSYIPFSIRKAFGLPTVEHQDAIYAYLFYRVLQRAENIHLFYNTETDILGQGEMSRLLQQLRYESGIIDSVKILHNSISPVPVEPIRIKKSQEVINALIALNESGRRFNGLSPTALLNYLQCKLRFYFNQVAKIKEPDEVEEDMDARVLGKFMHNIMEGFYTRILAGREKPVVMKSDFKNREKKIDELLKEQIRNEYRLNPDEEVVYEGQMKIVSEVVMRIVEQVLHKDEEMAPFEMVGVEKTISIEVPIRKHPGRIMLGGKIDRIDRKDGSVRIVDYKTGRDSLNFKSIESLFSEDGKLNKAAFQTLMYTWLYYKKYDTGKARLVPGLVNSKMLFDDDTPFGLIIDKSVIEDARDLMPAFEEKLMALLEELYDPATEFTQTEDKDQCKYCPYTRICYR